MARPRARGVEARRVKEPTADTQQKTILRFTRLEDIPIEDSFREKRLLEKGGSYRTLYPKFGPILVSPDYERRRIVEVYKRCYESGERSRDKVIRDFIAHFPHLTFQADWLKELFRNHVAPPARPEFSYNSAGNRVLRAVVDGFRGAAYMRGGGEKSNADVLKGVGRRTSLHAARYVQREIRGKLAQWENGLQRGDATPQWIDKQETEKLAELVHTYPKLPPFREKLKELLHGRQHYKASILIASKQFNVRARSLEQKSDFPF